MADPIRQALESLLNAEVHIHVAGPEYQQARDAARAALAAQPPAPAVPDEVRAAFAELERCQESLNRFRDLREELAAEPPAPDPREALAARPLLEAVARLGGCIGQHTVGEITTISDRAAAWLRENPPGQPVAIEPRGCPTPGACSCVEPPAPGPADHVPDAGDMVAADGEREELARWLDWLLPAFHREHDSTHASNCLRAAALLRQPAPAPVPVPVAEQPWKRPGWCDAQGRCWWFAPTEAISGGFRCAGWSLYAADPADEDTHCLPHWAIAIPQTPQAKTTHPTPTEPPTDD